LELLGRIKAIEDPPMEDKETRANIKLRVAGPSPLPKIAAKNLRHHVEATAGVQYSCASQDNLQLAWVTILLFSFIPTPWLTKMLRFGLTVFEEAITKNQHHMHRT
jgi:hypothetical protein